MKQMILTGIGSEQNFIRPPNGDHDEYKKLGVASYYLVFNDGELRVPCTESAAALVVKHMYEGEEANGNGHHKPTAEASSAPLDHNEVVDEDEGAEQV